MPRSSASSSSSGQTHPAHISFYVAKLSTGAGVLALPFAFQQCGVALSVAIVLLCVALNSVSCHLLIRCKHMLQALDLPLPAYPPPRGTYARLAAATLGRVGPLLVELATVVTLFGAAALYQVTCATLMTEIYSGLSQSLYVLLGCALLLPVIFIRRLAVLADVSGVAVLAYVLAFVCIFAWGGSQHAPTLSAAQIGPSAATTATSLLQAFGVVCFSLGIPILCFQLEESMARPSTFLVALDWTLVGVAGGYVAIGVIGVAIFSHARHTLDGDEVFGGVQSIILSNLPPDSLIGRAVKSILCAVLLMTSPMTFVPALDLLERMTFGERKASADAATASASPQRQATPGYGAIEEGPLSPASSASEPLAEEENVFVSPPGGAPSEDSPLQAHGVPVVPLVPDGSLLARSSLRLAMLALVASLAILLPCFTLLMAIIGACTLNLLSFILPPLFFVLLARVQSQQEPSSSASTLKAEADPPSSWQICGCGLFVCFGVGSMVATLAMLLQHGRCE